MENVNYLLRSVLQNSQRALWQVIPHKVGFVTFVNGNKSWKATFVINEILIFDLLYVHAFHVMHHVLTVSQYVLCRKTR